MAALIAAATVAETGEALLDALLAEDVADETAFALVVGDVLQTVLLSMFRLAA
jgi:hypothetical protein